MGHDWDIFQWPQHCSRPKIHQNVPTKSNLWRNVYMYCGFQSYLMQNFFWSIQSRISFDKKCSVSYFTFGIYALPSIMPQKILIHSKAKHCHNGPRLLSPFNSSSHWSQICDKKLPGRNLHSPSSSLSPSARKSPRAGILRHGFLTCKYVLLLKILFHFCKCF